MTVRFVDPRAEMGLPPEPYELRYDPSTTSPVFGILANGYPHSQEFASALATAIVRIVPTAQIVEYAKTHPALVVSDEVATKMVDACDAVITLYGHCGGCTSGTVRDAIKFARHGRPAIALVTEHFQHQGDFVARADGMPEIPRHVLPHPVAGRSPEFLDALSGKIVPELLDRLERGQ